MKKIFTLMLASVAVLTVNARQVVFDFTNPTALGITPSEQASKGVELPAEGVTVDGVVLTSTKVQKNPNVLFTKSDGVSYELRTYNTNTITFDAGEENITAVEFAGSDVKYAEVTGKSWTGEATSVTFTATATSKITSITLTIGEAAQIWTPDTISVSEAIALIDAGDTHDHFVKGVVMGAPFVTYASFSGKASFWLRDFVNEGDSIELYDGAGLAGANWASLEEAQQTIHEGDSVLVYAGALTFYAAKQIYEITGGYYAEMLGANPDIPVEEVDTITVAEAIEIGMALEDNTTTEQTYVVAGWVVTAYAPNDGYTDQTWYMADEAGVHGDFEAYRCTPDYLVEAGQFVFVKGKIKKYVKEGKDPQIEIEKGTATHLYGEGIENITLTEQAQKVVVDGVIYIVRDNKMFNLQGVQVR